MAGDSPTPTGQKLASPVPLGDYRVLREIGRGGMGVVYEAEQMLLGRRVALKVLPFAATMDARQLQRFQNEARAAACLHHPHIVPVYAVGCERGVHYYAMQFIEGQSLADVIGDLGVRIEEARKSGDLSPNVSLQSTICNLRSNTPLSNRERSSYHAVARLGMQAAEALHYAHEVGVIHRDVKPANLMLDGNANLWITDFGLAQIQGDAQLTMSGDLVGTLRYMSPEQALAKRVLVDHRTDIYSLGATLYELLTLQPVFPGADRQELLRQIAFEEPIAPRRHNKSIPAELETIVLKALEKNPADRYATAKELADDLERFVKYEPIRARRPSLGRRLRGWCWRHKPLVWSAAVILIALAACAVYVVSDRVNRLTKIEQHVREALAGTRTAIEANNLTLASQRLAEATGHLGGESEQLPAAGADITRIQQEIEDRQADEARFKQFVQMPKDAFDLDHIGADDGRMANVEKTLDLWGVTTTDDWSSRLESTYLTATQKRQVREAAYVAVLYLADRKVRWPQDNLQAASQSLKLLARIEALQKPTRAFYFVRSQCYRRQNNAAAADEDDKRFQAAAARTAWDYYFPGHTAGQNGDLKEAIRSYQAALRVQPNHIPSLIFLGMRLTSDEGNRLPEAIQVYTACSALMPDDCVFYRNRAICYTRLGQPEQAEAEMTAVIAKAKAKFGPDHREMLDCMEVQAWVYGQAGRLQEAAAVYKATLQKQRAKLGADDPDTLESMNGLALMLLKQKQFGAAEPLLRECLASREKHGPDDWLRFNTLSMLGDALLGQQKYGAAEPMLLDGYQGMKQRESPIHRRRDKVGLLEGLQRIVRLYEATGQSEKSRLWRRRQEWRTLFAEIAALTGSELISGIDKLEKTADPLDLVTLADFCKQPHKQLYATSARLYRAAIAAAPNGNINSSGSRADAAGAAALAGCGQGKEAARLGDAERAHLRRGPCLASE